jgi:MFS family permease
MCGGMIPLLAMGVRKKAIGSNRVEAQSRSVEVKLQSRDDHRLTVIYFCLVSANPTLGFWGPTIIKGLGVDSNMMIGILSAVPYIVGVIGTVLVGRHSDRTLERRYHSALSCLAAAVGLVAARVSVR